MRKSLLVLGCGLLAACLGPKMSPGHWPGAGAYVCVVNSTAAPVWLTVRDAVGHELSKGKLGSRGRVQFLWPFIDLNGGVFVARTAEGRVTMSDSFKPWGPKAWAWDVSTATPVSASRSFCPQPVELAERPDSLGVAATGR
jgi:hypothetical protein